MLATTATALLFYALAISAVGLALGLVLTRHILRSALYLMGVLLMSAGFYLLLDAEFLAGVQVLVYVGGIVVLLVFAVMLTSSVELLEDRPSPGRRLLGLSVAGLFFVLTAATFLAADFGAGQGASPTNSAALVGRMLLARGSQGYVLPFEIVSLLLLAAALGGIVIARKIPPGTGGAAPAAPASTGKERPC